MAGDNDNDDDAWKDGESSEGAKEHAEYMAQIAKSFMDAFQAHGFTREEALRLTIAIVPRGMGNGGKTE